jgi:hypothetical protein
MIMEIACLNTLCTFVTNNPPTMEHARAPCMAYLPTLFPVHLEY